MFTLHTKVTITKGCRARAVSKGDRAIIKDLKHMGPEFGHMVRVVLEFPKGKGRTLAFYARHPNRLADPTLGMNDGNPLHKIEIRA